MFPRPANWIFRETHGRKGRKMQGGKGERKKKVREI